MEAPAPTSSCTAFAGTDLILSGDLVAVALAVKTVIEGGETRPVLVFDDTSAEPVELDLRGTVEEVGRRLADRVGGASEQRLPGRPKLGVVGREVTLLPRHWDWLNAQPGGASVALRKLVEQARRAGAEEERVRLSQEAAYRFMSAIAGNEPGYEEAIRALFARDAGRFAACLAGWPADLRDYAGKLAEAALERPAGSGE